MNSHGRGNGMEGLDPASPLVFGQHGSWSRPEIQKFVLDSVFHDPGFTDFIQDQIERNNLSIDALGQLLGLLEQFLEGPHDNATPEQQEMLGRMKQALEGFTDHVATIQDVLNKETKPNPFGVFWPWPGRFQGPQSMDEITPYMLKHPILDANTPIGAAGSCFAEEVSRALQAWGYNYVVTEPVADGSDGVLTEANLEDKSTPLSCARWGILFNTPSFRQLAERAYGVRPFKRILLEETNDKNFTYFTDPYREGVFFESPEAYEADYEKHLAAVRAAFEKSEVFVITPGLNECWEFLEDGTVLSRNARHSSIRALTRPKTLSYQENIDALQGFIDIVRHHNPKIKFIISVSPVPFIATILGHKHHVVEANTHSKSMLRVVAEEIMNSNEDVYYFPSYELVTVCSANPWLEDLRHVNQETITRIMKMFQEIFVREK